MPGSTLAADGRSFELSRANVAVWCQEEAACEVVVRDSEMLFTPDRLISLSFPADARAPIFPRPGHSDETLDPLWGIQAGLSRDRR